MKVVRDSLAAVRRWASVLALAVGLSGFGTAPTRADDTKSTPDPVAVKSIPENLAELKAVQEQVKDILKKVVPATVGLQVGGASGSGVIIDKEGHILTAGHVSGAPDRPVTIIMPDGKRLKGVSLGRYPNIDSGLVKITDKADFPFVEMGKSAELKKGQWCIAVGHPGGFRAGRTPVVRLGRIQDSVNDANRGVIRTDCTLVGGDSGGPLFDLSGKVIGIHSRIGGTVTANLHVPVDTYRDTWDKLVAKETVGVNPIYLGIEADAESPGCKITKVTPDSPADKAGLKPDDVIKTFNGTKIETLDQLREQINKRKVGDKVTVEVARGSETVKLDVTLGKRDS